MAKTFNVTLWWTDGGNGTVTYETQSGILLWKPSFESIPDFKTLGYVADSPDVYYNYYIDSNGADHSLSDFQMDEIYEWIEKNFKVASGGGGSGGSGNAIVNIYAQADTKNPALILVREDGTKAVLPTGPMIQATPAYRIGMSMSGYVYHYDLSKHETRPSSVTAGKVWYVPDSITKEFVQMPFNFFDLGGSTQGMRIDRDTHTFNIPISGLECNLSMGMDFGFYPDINDSKWRDEPWIKLGGWPVGKREIYAELQHSHMGSTWETVATSKQVHDEIVVPSDGTRWSPSFNANGTRFTFISRQGDYRIMFKLVLTNNPEMFNGHIQGFTTHWSPYATYDSQGRDTAEAMRYRLNLTGAFKAQDDITTVPPAPRRN